MRTSHTVSRKVSLETVFRHNTPEKTTSSYTIPTKSYIILNDPGESLQRSGPPQNKTHSASPARPSNSFCSIMNLIPICSQPFPSSFPRVSQLVPSFSLFSTATQLVPTCSQLFPSFSQPFHNLFPTFSQLSPNLFATFSQLFPNLFPTLLQPFPNLLLPTFPNLCPNLLPNFVLTSCSQLFPTFLSHFSQLIPTSKLPQHAHINGSVP